MRTHSPERTSLRSAWRTGWRLVSVGTSGVLALAVGLGLTVAENPYAALAASIGVGPLLVLPMTRRLVWLVLASVAGILLTAALVAIQ